MLKLKMELFDVVFPLNLGPLTYKGPSMFKPGMLVRAELKKTLKTGIILRRATVSPSEMEAQPPAIKEIQSAIGDEPLFSNAMLRLISWMSDYYFAKEGIVLKEVSDLSQTARGVTAPLPQDWPGAETPFAEGRAFGVTDLPILLHCHGDYALSLLKRLIEAHRNIIILCPEIAGIKHISKALGDIAGERLSVLYSSLTKPLRRQAIERIIHRQSDIVIGSRLAVFAPLKEVSLIVVLNEESTVYKKEDGLRYNIRDIAVMRGFLEGSLTVLSSPCPSLESIYNAKCGKYTLLKPEPMLKRPKVRLVDMRFSKKISPLISKDLFDRAVSNIRNNKSSAFFINRKGYSILKCEDCKHIETCTDCKIPLVFYKEDKTLRCHYCGLKKPSGDTCSRCKGHNLTMHGSGIERVEEDIKAILNIDPLRLEGKKPKVILKTDAPVVIGTKTIARRPELKQRFSLIGVVNMDSYLQIPDFRSTEKAFQELIHLTEKAAPEAEIIIQTRSPHHPLFKYIKNYDFQGFYKDELAERKALMYPPFSKMAIIRGQCPRGQCPSPPAQLVETASLSAQGRASLLGPVIAITKKGKMEWKLLIKARSRADLHKALEAVLRSNKGPLTIDIDPVSI